MAAAQGYPERYHNPATSATMAGLCYADQDLPQLDVAARGSTVAPGWPEPNRLMPPPSPGVGGLLLLRLTPR